MCLKRKHEAVAPHRQGSTEEEEKKSHTKKEGVGRLKTARKGQLSWGILFSSVLTQYVLAALWLQIGLLHR